MLPRAVLNKIEETFGERIVASGQCAAVAEDIFQKTKEVVGETSVQRWFGLVSDHDRRQLRSTLDIIARYVGYGSWELLHSDIEHDVEISQFAALQCVTTDSLTAGTQIRITYQPGRLVLMTYLGGGTFIVNEAERCKLRRGDRLRISQLAIGFELIVTDVERDGLSLGPYEAAKLGGLTSIEQTLAGTAGK